MQLFYERTGDDHTAELPNDIENVQLSIENDIVSISGIHSGDGRVSTTQYRVSVDKGRSDRLDTFDLDDFDYVQIVERGFWNGHIRLTVITLSEVDQ